MNSSETLFQGIATIEETLADYRETVNSLAMNEQIVKLRQKIEIEQKLKQRQVSIWVVLVTKLCW